MKHQFSIETVGIAQGEQNSFRDNIIVNNEENE